MAMIRKLLKTCEATLSEVTCLYCVPNLILSWLCFLPGLKESLLKRDVVEVDDGENKLYFFQRRRMGIRESAKNERGTNSTTQATQSFCESVAELVDTVHWKIEATPKDLAKQCHVWRRRHICVMVGRLSLCSKCVLLASVLMGKADLLI